MSINIGNLPYINIVGKVLFVIFLFEQVQSLLIIWK